ncbi:MAG: BON domain-containing protein [Sulfuricaulis sp.]|uniref:BON domain-containing protein n=1 Tax=Sulfuricaulis sp. TaxID=2003553 RepID=UPI0025F6EDA3|nr:BON domain-containing protein [Sulfuricaulis sp.]MCR4348081.1 BON domain-containing protein [Sulfuricaulis sp.]
MKNLFGRSWVWMAVLLIGLAGCAGTSSRDSTGEYIDDAAITTKVKSGMFADKEVSGLNISVDTIKGVVYLSGTAATRQESNKAATIARNVAGVKSVVNKIQVK